MTNNPQNFNVVYSRVLEDTKHHAVTRKLATFLSVNEYITVGEFIRQLSDRELSDLLYISEFFGEDVEDDSDEPSYVDDFILIAAMLSEAEGSGIKLNEESAPGLVSMLTSFLIIESLDRKGMAKAIHKNMSFGEDMMDAVIAKKVE